MCLAGNKTPIEAERLNYVWGTGFICPPGYYINATGNSAWGDRSPGNTRLSAGDFARSDMPYGYSSDCKYTTELGDTGYWWVQANLYDRGNGHTAARLSCVPQEVNITFGMKSFI